MKAKSQKLKARSNTKSLILYLNTSSEEAVISLHQGSEKISELKWRPGRELSKTLLQKYSHILKNLRIDQGELKGICVFVGPGSFTGLRIGISFANGLAFGLDIPVYETKIRGKLDLKNPKKIAVPRYGSPPRITKSKKK